VTRIARPGRRLALRLRAGRACVFAAALWTAACGPSGDEEVPEPARRAGPPDSAAAHGRWSIAVGRGRDGREVVRNGPVPMLPRGAVAAVTRWRIPSPGQRMVTGWGRLFVFGYEPDRLFVVPLPADSAPRPAALPYPLGSYVLFAASRGVLAAPHSTGYMRGELVLLPPGGGRVIRVPVDGMAMQVEGVDSGFVVNAQRESRTAYTLVRTDGSVRSLELPVPPYMHRWQRQVRWVALADDGALVMASSHWPGFRSTTLEGRVLRDVLTDPPDAPPFPEWNDEPYGWIYRMDYDRQTGLYALAETIRIPMDREPDTALHLFTSEGVFLATVRITGTVHSFELTGGRLYALLSEREDESILAAFDLQIPPAALDSAHAAYLRARGAR
jgi:hypothetical protein